MSHSDENGGDDSPQSEAVNDRNCRVAQPRSALGLFLAGLIAESGTSSSARSSTSTASSPLPAPSIRIVDDHAKALKRSCSLSFRRAKRNMMNRRRRARAIDVKRISRWESYPQTLHKNKKHGKTTGLHALECKPQRRPSPLPTSASRSVVTQYQTREVIHRALEITKDIRPDRSSLVDESVTHPHRDFTPCSTWLEVVSKHASYSPKPAPKCMTKNSIRSSDKAEVVPKGPGGSLSLKTSLKAKRSAALCGAPRRPQRQASLTNVTLELLSLEDTPDNCEAASRASTTEEANMKHSDEGPNLNAASRRQHHHHHHSHRHHHHHPDRQTRHSSGTRPGRETKAAAKHVHDDEDSSEGSFQDASSAEWKQIGARSA